MPVVQVDGARIHYQVHGSAGPKVVLIQGVGVDRRGWGPQVDTLQDRFRMLVLDNRGIGDSGYGGGDVTIEQMATDVLAVMDAQRWSDAHLVGHSMGGVIAQQVAIYAPDRVLSLSLLCTFCRGRDAARITPWIVWIGLRTRVGTRAMRRRAFLELIVAPGVLAEANVDELAAELALVFGRDLADQPSIAMKQVRALSRHDISEELHRLSTIPTVIVSAEHDAIALPEYGRQLQGAIPGSQFLLFDGAAHACTVDRAEEINAVLAQHWSSDTDDRDAGRPVTI